MRRKPNRPDSAKLLSELAPGRAALNDMLGILPPNSGTAHLARLVVSNMDDLATLLTGDRQHFHNAARPASHLIPPPDLDQDPD
jgi:hypothetical protein